MDMGYERPADAEINKVPLIVAAVFFILVGSVLAFVTTQRNTVSPVPEQGLRVIFVSPKPTDTPAPTASASATPQVEEPTERPQSKPTATETPQEDESPTPTEAEATETPTP